MLKQRLLNRRQDKDEVISGTDDQKAQDELSHYPEFDYLIVNDDFEKAARNCGESIGDCQSVVHGGQLNKQAKLLSSCCDHSKMVGFY